MVPAKLEVVLNPSKLYNESSFSIAGYRPRFRDRHLMTHTTAMEAVSNPQTLAQTGLETIRLFGKVKNIDKLPSLNLAEEWPKALFAGESDRFELWAVNLGLFVAGHGSLSYRLREAERLESTIRRFMEDLNSSLVEGCSYTCLEGRYTNTSISSRVLCWRT